MAAVVTVLSLSCLQACPDKVPLCAPKYYSVQQYKHKQAQFSYWIL